MANIIFKPTENCNSRCIYCDVVTKKHSAKTMPLELLKHVFKEINKYLLALPNEEVKVTWHGGEPLLLGVDYFRKAYDFQNKYCKKTKNRISHCIQSNLTLVNKDFLDIFRKLGMNCIGTSYEPIPNVRGGSKNLDSDKYNRLFMRGINLLEENNFGWGFIYVVTKKALERPLDIFYFLSNFKLSGGFNLNPVLIYGEDKWNIGITPEEFTDFLGGIFSVWWKNMDRYPDIQPFNSFVKTIKDGQLSLGCVYSGDCAFHYVYIGPDGEASQCGRSADWNIISYGNIKDRSLLEIMRDKSRRQILRRNEVLPKGECKECRFWYICHGGCPLDAYYEYGGFMHRTNWCAPRKMFLEKYFEPITGLKMGNHEKEIGCKNKK